MSHVVAASAVLATRSFTQFLHRGLSLDVCDTLMFDVGPQDPVSVKCGGIAMSEGSLGRVDDRIAIDLNRGLNRQKMTLASFEKAMQKEMEAS